MKIEMVSPGILSHAKLTLHFVLSVNCWENGHFSQPHGEKIIKKIIQQCQQAVSTQFDKMMTVPISYK